ncbi:unnamed protein product [Didymodactylos carnosus]|uniref:Uncharacterized protein n=1 Tax=Didymodactylos carnosus TaxID=1234261 RepID=A0A813VFC7_9BILA|nr:unnamed protein product [Didymodactylos carnosus]CAF3627397.1 unnamed protein product [Didymodactylos carnosus]
MPREKDNYIPQTKHSSFYTGGPFALSEDGCYLICTYNVQINVIDTESQNIIRTLSQDTSEIASIALSNVEGILVVAYRNQLIRQWNWQTGECLRTWKSVHKGAISCMLFNETGTLLATGGTDYTVKIWDVQQQYYTHNLKGALGIIRALIFYTNDSMKMHLISGSDDGKIHVHNLHSTMPATILDGHMSAITAFVLDKDILISAGRDRVVIIWDLQTMMSLRTIPVMEAVESLIVLQSNANVKQLRLKQALSSHDKYFFTFGNAGLMKLWSIQTGQCLHVQEDKSYEKSISQYQKDKEHQQVFLQAFYNKKKQLFYASTIDHTIVSFDIQTLTLQKQFIGELGEILDVRFFGKENVTHVIVASNDEKLKIFDYNTWHCQVLKGHTDIVIGLDISYDHTLIATCSKDDIVRIWSYNKSLLSFHCVGIAEGHTADVATVAFAKTSNLFLVSGSQDTTVKVWSLESLNEDGKPSTLTSSFTLKTHDKEVNSVAVSFNDKHFATGSADKTAKVWDIRSQKLLGVLRGHRRGIWCVQFSPVNSDLATASTDGSIKIWSSKDFVCLQTIEGHDASVLRIAYLSAGTQLISSGSDGLLKLWDLKTTTCKKSIDAHDGKIWGMAPSSDESLLVTCASDSSVIIWRDSTEEDKQAAREKAEELLLM